MIYRGVTVDQNHFAAELRLWGMGLILCGLCVGIDAVGWLEWFRGGVERGMITIDMRVLQGKQWLQQPMMWVQQSYQASERIAHLEERLTRVAVDSAKLQTLQSQVSALEAIALRVQSGQRADRLAQLIRYDDRIMVGVGSRDGIIPGQIITDQAGALIGRVGKVGRYMSEVDTLDDAAIRIPVQTTSGSSKGILIGKERGKTALTDVLQSEPLMVGDVLITVGTESGFPSNLVVGQVTQLTGNPEDVTKGGEVTLLGHLDGWVAIW